MKRLPVLLALAGVLALSAIGISQAAPIAPTATNQHFYATVHTTFAGYATVDLQANVVPADVVIKVASGATHLGGEIPSFATVNFAGFVDENTIRVRVIGWRANTVTGNAIFAYYSNKDADIAVDVYQRTAVPTP